MRKTRANRPRSSDVYLIITAYSVTSAIWTDGDCVTISGIPVSLPTPFGVVTSRKPFVTDIGRVQSIVESSFVTWSHRAPTCSLARVCLDGHRLFGNARKETGALNGTGGRRFGRMVGCQSNCQI